MKGEVEKQRRAKFLRGGSGSRAEGKGERVVWRWVIDLTEKKICAISNMQLSPLGQKNDARFGDKPRRHFESSRIAAPGWRLERLAQWTSPDECRGRLGLIVGSGCTKEARLLRCKVT